MSNEQNTGTFSFTEGELESLDQVKKQFEASVEYINDILAGKEVDLNLGYIIRDWTDFQNHFRNDELMGWLTKINEAKLRKEDSS